MSKMSQELLTPTLCTTVEDNVLKALNQHASHVVAAISMHSPRAVGDAVQDFLSQHLESLFPDGIIKGFEDGFERRSMEDMAFYDTANCYHAVDVKTQNVDTAFSMPNLISVKRLAKFYQNDTNFFDLLVVKYKQVGEELRYTACHLLPIEHLKWECLTIGALGWGQIQIANANNITADRTQTRKQWMLKLCGNLESFYEEEIGKIRERESWFSDIREYWEARQE